MHIIEPSITEHAVRQFIDSQIDTDGLTAAIEDARRVYEQAKVRRVELKRQLAAHDANKPVDYSGEWIMQRYQIVNLLLACIDRIDQSQLDLNKAQSALWKARHRVITRLYS